MLQLADGGIHARFQHGGAGGITMTAQPDRGILGRKRMVEIQEVVLRSRRCVGEEGNNSIKGTWTIQVQGGKVNASVSDTVYR